MKETTEIILIVLGIVSIFIARYQGSKDNGRMATLYMAITTGFMLVLFMIK